MAQVGFDLAAMLASSWIGERTEPSAQLLLLSWTYAVDAALAPLGLLIASEAMRRPGLLLIALSPTAMMMFFARERHQRLEQTQALSTAYRGTALLLGDVVEADDPYTGMHSRDVVDLSLAVCDAIGLNSARRRDVEFAALIHDVGKIRVPKEIVNKRGPLDPTVGPDPPSHNRRRTNAPPGRRHPVQRRSHLRSTHERFDGGGYPDGLAGDAIAIESRVVSVCDSFSAMTTDRPYRAALSVGQAVAELRHCGGSQFDPGVVAALTQVLGTAIETVPESCRKRQPTPVRAVSCG